MNRVTQTFMDLVQVDSVSGKEQAFADYLVRHLEPLTDHVQKDAYGNIYARIDGTGQPLFYSAHLDTVEPGIGIKPQVKDGYLVSDGTTILGVDNKAALAGMIELLHLIKEQKISHRPLELVLTLSEEEGNYGAVNYDYSLIKAKEGYCFDYNGPVGTFITASPFYERIDLTLEGKAAHGSSPELGINVLSIFQELLNQWLLGRIDADTTFNLGLIQGGSARNTIPGVLSLQGELRSFSEDSLNKHRTKLKELLEQICQKWGASFKADFVLENPGYKLTDADIQKVMTQLQKAGITTIPVVKGGISDANMFHGQGLKCINFCDGGERSHTVEERIKISQLEELVNLMTALVSVDIDN